MFFYKLLISGLLMDSFNGLPTESTAVFSEPSVGHPVPPIIRCAPSSHEEMSLMQALLLNPAVLLATTETGYLAYNTATDRLHELNPLAALLVELCDGRRTTDELLELASPHVPAGLTHPIRDWLIQATHEDLLVVAQNGGPQSLPEELSAEQLDELSRRLRDVGKIQAAYLCQARANELQPKHLLR
jgi:hypothetical protein